MKILSAIFAISLLSACGQAQSKAQGADVQPSLKPDTIKADTVKFDTGKSGTGKSGTGKSGTGTPENNKAQAIKANASHSQDLLRCTGLAKQGGLVECKSQPNANIRISRGGDDYFTTKADENGALLVGFDRDETYAEIVLDGVPASKISYTFTPRKYDISKIDGLPPSQVSTFTPAQLTHIRAASARKKVGFASREKSLGFVDGFTSPLKKYRKTTNFGAQRILNGEPKKPHYGVDMAAPVGTPILAPADGVVSLADNDMYFEGQMVMVDHGQGLNSIYLHMSEIDVTAGQHVKRGDQLGLVGSTGRSTGPHLCWRLKWRNRNLDPELITHWPKN